MSRPLRIEFNDAFYHVMNRGRRREDVFFDDGDRYLFFSVLKEAIKLFNIKIYAYCLMSNHYHLLISTPDANLSRAMRHINGVYTQKVNRKHNFEGSLFKGRYKAVLFDESNYFSRFVRYIHRNPRRAGLEQTLGNYKWSSYNLYLRKQKRFEWLSVDEGLSYFGDYKKVAIKNYKDYMKRLCVDDFEKRFDSTNWPAIYGNEKFKEEIKKLFLGKNLTEISSSEIKNALPANSVDESIKMFMDFFKISRDQYNKSHKDYFKLRDYAIRYCREELKLKNRDISKGLSLTSSTISTAYQAIKEDKAYLKVIKNIKT
ncbi:MAG: transposase [Candidatus Omnitrophica bacterium]|nr:transposase [Candidatus Omnitrophota bacterium]